MKYITTCLAIMVNLVPAVVSLPATGLARQFKIPTCGAKICLTETNGLFDGCEPNDLACLCRLEQTEVTRYVSVVQPCIDGEAGHAECTDGAIFQYKDVLTTVCADKQFGKLVEFPATV